MESRNPIPIKGDRVRVDGWAGEWIVYLVDRSLECADLKPLGKDELPISSIPWDALTFLDEQDTSLK